MQFFRHTRKRSPATMTATLLVALGTQPCGCTEPASDVRDGERTNATFDVQQRTGASEMPLVELFSWWTAPGEAEAFQRLVDDHRAAYPDTRIFNGAAASGERGKTILLERLRHGDFPDLYQENLHVMKTNLQHTPGHLLKLDTLFDELDLRKVIYREVLSDLTIDGHLYAVPLNLHRENSLIYNKRLFRQFGLAPPRTLDDLLVACDVFKRNGVTPIAISHQGWILRIMFHSILLAKMGIHHYNDYFLGKLPLEDPKILEAIDLLDELLTNYTNSDAAEPGFGWMSAAQAVISGDAAMYFHGDWAKGYAVQMGANPETDVGVVAAPGTQGAFLYSVDVFAIPLHAPNPIGAKNFLRTIVQPSTQSAFNQIKGASPVRIDAPLGPFDSDGRETVRELQTAEVRLQVRCGDGWEVALTNFAKTRDREALVREYVTNPPMD